MKAHITLHFALGIATGTAIILPLLVRTLRLRRPLAPVCTRWIAWSYAIGVWAVMPSILRRLQIPETICSHPVMNIFLLHPLIDWLRPGGMLIGELGIVFFFALQYACLVGGIFRADRYRFVHPSSTNPRP